MQKDYDRTICNSCLNKGKCEEYRSKLWCSECQKSLICTMNGTSHDKQCPVAMQHWTDDLPNKCLLVEQVMLHFVENGAQTGSYFIPVEKDFSLIYCPRCMQPTFVWWLTYTCDIGHCAICNAYTSLRCRTLRDS
jgi:hypothetical protein